MSGSHHLHTNKTEVSHCVSRGSVQREKKRLLTSVRRVSPSGETRESGPRRRVPRGCVSPEMVPLQLFPCGMLDQRHCTCCSISVWLDAYKRLSVYPAINTGVKDFKKPLHKELSRPNPTLTVGDLVYKHRYRSQSPDCESRYRDTMVEKTNCRLAQWFHPVGATRERSPDC